MMYSEFNIKRLETYRATAGFAPTSGFAEADLLSRKTKLKTHRRSLFRGKSNALSKKPFEKWHRQSPISVNPCNLCNLWLNSSCLSAFVAEYLCALCLSRQSLGDGGCPLWLKINQSK